MIVGLGQVVRWPQVSGLRRDRAESSVGQLVLVNCARSCVLARNRLSRRNVVVVTALAWPWRESYGKKGQNGQLKECRSKEDKEQAAISRTRDLIR